MKTKTITLATLFIGGMGLLNAATVTTNSTQDLVLSFSDLANTNKNLEVDLGSFTQFTNGTSFTVAGSTGLAFSDLSAIYGASWNTSSDANGAQLFFGVVGTTGTGGGSNGVRGDTLFGTGDAGMAPADFTSQSGQAAAAGNIATFVGGLNNRTSTANSTRSASITTSDPGSFFQQSGEATNSNFGPYFQNFNNPPFMHATDLSGGSVRADLWEILPTVNAQIQGAAVDLGFFTLTANDLTFTSLQPVPEPSTYALLALGLVLTAGATIRRHRRS